VSQKDPWSTPEAVAGFVHAAPNATLMQFAQNEQRRGIRGDALDVGCGAARNAVPLALSGWRVFGTDASRPMLEAAAGRADAAGVRDRVHLIRATMASLPIATGSVDMVVAHGIWNLASSGAEFRQAVREGARVARPGAALFVFTFSRHTLPAHVTPVAGETFVFTQFSGQRQCFLTDDQLLEELAAAGYVPDPALPLRELNRPKGLLHTQSGPVIYEGTFRLTAQAG
jgi:SAM-dependent methyltransferase